MNYLSSEGLLKTAARVDHAQLRELSALLQAGDLVNFETQYPSVAHTRGIRAALKDKLIGGSISQISGNPNSHTAIVSGIDPATGRISMVHNYEQGGGGGGGSHVQEMSPGQFKEFARDRKMNFYRPEGATAAQGQEAAAAALAAAKRKAGYAYGDIPQFAAREGADALVESSNPSARRLGSAGRSLLDTLSHDGRTPSCDPATGVCSHLAAHSWSEPLGGEEQARKLMGNTPTGGTHTRVSVTPASIAEAAEAGKLRTIGTYTPKGMPADMGSAVKSRLGSKLRGLVRRLRG